MYHTIEFSGDYAIDIETSSRHRLERIRVQRGTRLKAQIKPYVVDTGDDLFEVADLFFDDGTSARGVRFDVFSFVD